MLKVLYLVPNLGDPAVERRVRMMRLGGAEVAVAGFRRGNRAPPPAVELGQTLDARFGHRLVAVAGAYWSILARIDLLDRPDVIVARNLEMLPLATRLQRAWEERPSLVYECLDIHRLMLGRGVVGQSMRAAERHFMRKASLLLTSSPAFVREYFLGMRQSGTPTMLLENKVLDEHGARGSNPALAAEPAEVPLRIGWFGVLRCNKSLAALDEFTRRMSGRVEVVLRGRPALHEFDDFNAVVGRNPYLSYEGPYQRRDLPRIYSEVHLAWAIDFFEEGLNSKWLLPNRIYEGCFHGAVPIAFAGTETASFLRSIGIGIILPEVTPTTLAQTIGGLDHAELRRLAGAVAALDRRHFAFERSDCIELVARLSRLGGGGQALLEAAG